MSPKSISIAVTILAFAIPTLKATGQESNSVEKSAVSDGPVVVVLGVAQDAGFPQANCKKECCKAAFSNPKLAQAATCIGIADPQSKQTWMIECTPNLTWQLAKLNEVCRSNSANGVDGVLLTHAHIGHYTGLMFFGREVMGAKELPTFVMPRMKKFLRTNGPWSQLVKLKNVSLQELTADRSVNLNARIKVTPFLVPHRDEFSETVGYRVEGPKRTFLFIPDIDKWEKWERKIVALIREVDFAFLDATFYANGELPNRNMSEIPHPFVEESIKKFETLPKSDRAKIHFIHFNHTNPLLNSESDAVTQTERAGFRIAKEGMRIKF